MSSQESCEFCRNEFDHTVIKEYENWQVQLFLDQKYLGRSLVKLNQHKVDLFSITPEERNELYEKIIPELKNALDNLFDPDLYNYASLGNDCRHLHLHVIPRYQEPREFKGLEFEDENWNRHYKTDKQFRPDEKLFNQLKTTISEEIHNE